MRVHEMTLDQLGSVSRGRSRHRPRDAEFLYGGPYPFVQTGDVKKAGLYIRDFEQTYSEAGLAQSKLWPVGTLCITIAATKSRKPPILNIEACFPDSVIGFIAKPEKADARFVKYLFDAVLKMRFQSFTQGAAQDNLSQAKLLSIKFPVPEPVVQREIADILFAYDDLIENNRQRIALLEAAARLLYREWFVHFRFPGHEHIKITDGLPDGWERSVPSGLVAAHIGGGWGKDQPEGNEGEPAFVIRGTDIPRVENGDISSVGLRFHSATSLRSRVLVPYDVVFEVSGGSSNQPIARTLLLTEERLKLWNTDVICASFCKRFTFSTAADALYFILHIREHRDRGDVLVYQKESASSLKNFNFDAFMSSYEFLIPPVSLRKLFSESIDPIVRHQSVLAAQIRQLAKARDLLLPRLMNGEIAV